MAYFAPNAGLLRRFGRITRGGGQVRMLLPARSDNPATVGAARLLYGFLLKRGVVISEYEPQRLHSKVIVIDDIVLIGSANLDMRSLYVNMEMVLRIRDAAFARQCRAFLAEQERDATVITPRVHRQRATMLNRIRWFASWLVVSAIDYSVTRRLNFGLGEEK
jgi:cardiolipin synthase A/B